MDQQMQDVLLERDSEVLMLEEATENAEGAVNITSIAEEAICLSGDAEPVEAAEQLLRILRNSYPRFYKSKSEEIVTAWAMEKIRDTRRFQRTRIITYQNAKDSPNAAQKPAHNRPLSAQSLRAMADAWLDWPIGNKTLRDARRPEVNAAAAKYLGDASIYTKRGNWLKAIADALPDDAKTVSSAMTEKKIHSLAVKFGMASK